MQYVYENHDCLLNSITAKIVAVVYALTVSRMVLARYAYRKGKYEPKAEDCLSQFFVIKILQFHQVTTIILHVFMIEKHCNFRYSASLPFLSTDLNVHQYCFRNQSVFKPSIESTAICEYQNKRASRTFSYTPKVNTNLQDVCAKWKSSSVAYLKPGICTQYWIMLICPIMYNFFMNV